MEPKNPTIDDLYQTAGESLSRVLEVIFPDEDERLNRFYHSRNQITNETPYEICLDGRQGDLESELIANSIGGRGG